MSSSNSPILPRRKFGRSGIQLSTIGLGGVLLMDTEQAHANRLVAEFVERGGNYFDVAPSYGNAEVKLAPALEPYRKNSFLACKSTHRTAVELEAELKQSLATLRTDYFDLYQLHALTDVAKDVDAVFAKGGAMEYLAAAKKSGLVRHLGFSAHSVEAACAAMDRFPFDSILFPVNSPPTTRETLGPRWWRGRILRRRAFGAQGAGPPEMAEGEPGEKKLPQVLVPAADRSAPDRTGPAHHLSQPVTSALPPGDEKSIPPRPRSGAPLYPRDGGRIAGA